MGGCLIDGLDGWLVGWQMGWHMGRIGVCPVESHDPPTNPQLSKSGQTITNNRYHNHNLHTQHAQQQSRVVCHTQWPVTVCQWPVRACQWPVTACQWPVTTCQWPVTAGQWPVTTASKNGRKLECRLVMCAVAAAASKPWPCSHVELSEIARGRLDCNHKTAETEAAAKPTCRSTCP